MGSRGEALSWLRRVRSNLAGKMEILVYGISRTSSILFHEFDLTVALDWHYFGIRLAVVWLRVRWALAFDSGEPIHHLFEDGQQGFGLCRIAIKDLVIDG